MLAIRMRRAGSKNRPVLPRRGHREPVGARRPVRRGARALQPAHQAGDDRRSTVSGWRTGLASGARPSDTVRTLLDRMPPAPSRHRPGRRRRREPARATSSRSSPGRWPGGPTTSRSPRASGAAQTVVELTMAPGELGRVIGRQGRTATALRTLAAAAGELDGPEGHRRFPRRVGRRPGRWTGATHGHRRPHRPAAGQPRPGGRRSRDRLRRRTVSRRVRRCTCSATVASSR